MEQLVDSLNGVIWSPALIFLCLAAGLYFSLRTRFAQVRHFIEMLRLMRGSKASAEGVSSFQALAMSLSGRVGTGNIAVNRQQDPGNGVPLSDVLDVFLPRALSDCFPIERMKTDAPGMAS